MSDPIQAVRVHKLQPGDLLVFKLAQPLERAELVELQHTVDGLLERIGKPSVKAMVLNPGIDLEVIRAELTKPPKVTITPKPPPETEPHVYLRKATEDASCATCGRAQLDPIHTGKSYGPA